MEFWLTNPPKGQKTHVIDRGAFILYAVCRVHCGSNIRKHSARAHSFKNKEDVLKRVTCKRCPCVGAVKLKMEGLGL